MGNKEYESPVAWGGKQGEVRGNNGDVRKGKTVLSISKLEENEGKLGVIWGKTRKNKETFGIVLSK